MGLYITFDSVGSSVGPVVCVEGTPATVVVRPAFGIIASYGSQTYVGVTAIGPAGVSNVGDGPPVHKVTFLYALQPPNESWDPLFLRVPGGANVIGTITERPPATTVGACVVSFVMSIFAWGMGDFRLLWVGLGGWAGARSNVRGRAACSRFVWWAILFVFGGYVGQALPFGGFMLLSPCPVEDVGAVEAAGRRRVRVKVNYHFYLCSNYLKRLHPITRTGHQANAN